VHLWRSLRTVFQLASRVEDLEQEWTDVRMDLADQLDKLDRLMRRLTLRAQRSDQPTEIARPEVTEAGNRKNHLRAIAREKGIIR